VGLLNQTLEDGSEHFVVGASGFQKQFLQDVTVEDKSLSKGLADSQVHPISSQIEHFLLYPGKSREGHDSLLFTLAEEAGFWIYFLLHVNHRTAGMLGNPVKFRLSLNTIQKVLYGLIFDLRGIGIRS
jgi:hypothetical protein